MQNIAIILRKTAGQRIDKFNLPPPVYERQILMTSYNDICLSKIYRKKELRSISDGKTRTSRREGIKR